MYANQVMSLVSSIARSKEAVEVKKVFVKEMTDLAVKEMG